MKARENPNFERKLSWAGKENSKSGEKIVMRKEQIKYFSKNYHEKQGENYKE